MEFIKAKKEELKYIYKRLEESFILAERRDFCDFERVFENPRFTIYNLYNEGVNVGFVSVWQLKEFAFIEHLVVDLGFRNKGYGSKILELAKQKWNRIVLEAEPALTEIASRRLNFYKRNGFLQNEFKYIQPSYRIGGECVELVIMSYPSLVNEREIVKEIHEKVYNK